MDLKTYVTGCLGHPESANAAKNRDPRLLGIKASEYPPDKQPSGVPLNQSTRRQGREEVVALFVEESTWKAKLLDMAQRNAAIDLSPSPDSYDEGKLPVFKVRMLHMNDDAIFLEYPTTPEAIKLFRADETVRLNAGTQDQRWEMYANVIGRVKLNLNANKQIPALKLSLPLSVKVGQRRDYFRAPTAAMDIKSVVMMPLDSRDANPPAGSLRAYHKNLVESGNQSKTQSNMPRPFLGRLLNISGAGIGVAIKKRHAVKLASNQWFWVQLDLPTSDDPIFAFALAVRLDQYNEEVFHLGLCLEWPDPLAAKESVESVVQFTTWVQRTELKKRREG